MTEVPILPLELYYLVGSLILAEKEKEGFKIIDSQRELFIFFLGHHYIYRYSINIIKLTENNNNIHHSYKDCFFSL